MALVSVNNLPKPMANINNRNLGDLAIEFRRRANATVTGAESSLLQTAYTAILDSRGKPENCLCSLIHFPLLLMCKCPRRLPLFRYTSTGVSGTKGAVPGPPSFLYVLFDDWIFPEPRHSRHPSNHSHRLQLLG